MRSNLLPILVIFDSFFRRYSRVPHVGHSPSRIRSVANDEMPTRDSVAADEPSIVEPPTEAEAEVGGTTTRVGLAAALAVGAAAPAPAPLIWLFSTTFKLSVDRAA